MNPTRRNASFSLSLALVAAFVGADAHAAPEDRSLAVGKQGGSLAFWVSKPGPVAVHLTAPSAVRARLVGPKGEAAAKGPATTLDLSATATDADVALGKVWVVTVAPEAGTPKVLTATLKVDSPGAPMTDKELVAQIDAAARAQPKVPQALPTPTPLMPDAFSVTRIVTAKIPNSKVNASAIGGKVVRSSSTVPSFVPRPPATAPKFPVMANNNNYGGAAADPSALAGRSFVPIFAVDVADDDGSHACTAAACSIKAGDVITFTLGPGIDTIGHEVHFVFFEPAHDYAVSVLEWKDDARKLAVQMPHLGADAFDKLGAIYIGTASGKASSVFFGFKYDPTVTLFLPMDGKIFPAPASVFTSAPSAGAPDHPEYSFIGPIDNATRWVVMRGAAVSASGRDTFFGGVTLKNGWLVKRAESQGWASSLVPTLQANHTVVDVKPNTATPTFSIDWTSDAATTLSYSVGLKVQGRDGTLPF